MFLFIYFLEFYLNVPSLFVTIGVNEMINMARNSLNCCKGVFPKKKDRVSSPGRACMNQKHKMGRSEAILHPKIFPNIQKA